jgi:regulator of protease activity HflC (stomatin/prohibitin superfamily)
MLFLKYLCLAAGFGALIAAAATLIYDVYLAERNRRIAAGGGEEPSTPPKPVRWQLAGRLASFGALAAIAGLSIAVVPSGMAGVRVSQISGTRPEPLYPGVHFVKPMFEHVVLYDTRAKVFTATAAPDGKIQALKVQAKEGLGIGLAVTVRYRLDAHRIDYIHDNLPQPVEEELVSPAVASVFRELVPNYTVREVFATRREEIRQQAAGTITKKLAADGIVVQEVMLRDVQLPAEYAQGLEGLLLKEQENDRMATETEIQAKQVRIAELQAEAEKARDVKRAEGEAQVRVLQAKAESDAMQYTLPLKQKQIEQTRLEAEARKESTIKNAEAAAQAKVIDSHAEQERRQLLADAEANRIRVTSAADAERLKGEAAALKQNPLLINKIIAEKLSDKVQVMMVPTDTKMFLTNDLLHGEGGQTYSTDQPRGAAAIDDTDDTGAGSKDPPRGPTGHR